MLFIIGLIVVLVLYSVLHSGNAQARDDEYCNLECIERKIRDRSICC